MLLRASGCRRLSKGSEAYHRGRRRDSLGRMTRVELGSPAQAAHAAGTTSTPARRLCRQGRAGRPRRPAVRREPFSSRDVGGCTP
ncbi:Integrase [Modestobacter italicus]|uniref:Integrase n=1 Tax=Modestobacter italicus (strain DSM 44449 / CECT 9708 / BC 501) TaxID=2732864 RepID=I4F0T1_MODI5|nr:Integrase [Modestobacter marinus]